MLITETGAGLPNAESYASVAAADARNAALGVTTWAALDTGAKEIALRNATIFMTANYRTRWAGRRVYQAQALDWPRWGVCVDGFDVPSTTVPADIVNACIDLAARASAGVDLMPDQERAIKEDTVGPITTIYVDGAPEQPRYTAVDHALAPYLCGSGLSGRMVRS
jgi:hypothetical protein